MKPLMLTYLLLLTLAGVLVDIDRGRVVTTLYVAAGIYGMTYYGGKLTDWLFERYGR